MDVIGAMLQQLMSNPALQSVALGAVVKIVVDRLKFLFKKVDEDGMANGYKLPLQLVVMVCSGLAAMADLAVKGSLQTYDPNLIATFLTVTIPTYFSALASHKVGNMVVKEVKELKK